MELKIGDTVRIIIKSKFKSINQKGDIGTIMDIIETQDGYDIEGLNYKVYVEGRTRQGEENIANYHQLSELEFVSRDIDYDCNELIEMLNNLNGI